MERRKGMRKGGRKEGRKEGKIVVSFCIGSAYRCILHSFFPAWLVFLL